jgi:threonine synthase
VIRADDEVVVLVTGNGLKTPDARLFGLDGEARSRVDAASLAGPATGEGRAGRARPGLPGLAPVIRPSFDAFTAWLES